MKPNRQESGLRLDGGQSRPRSGGRSRLLAVRAARTLVQIGAVGLLLAGCKMQEGGFGGTVDDPPPPPIAPATAPGMAGDAATLPPIDPAGTPVAPAGPTVTPTADAGASSDAKPGAKPTPPKTTPPIADGSAPSPAVDAKPGPKPPVAADAGMTTEPPAAGKPDLCAPPPGAMLAAQVRAKVRGAEDFTFDGAGNLLLFQDRDVLRLDSDTQPFVVLRNVISLGNGNGALHALPDGDLLIADTGRDNVLRVDPTGKHAEHAAMQIRSPLKIVPSLSPGSVYVTSSSNVIYLLDTATGQTKSIQLDYEPAGIAIDVPNRKLYVGAVGRSAVYSYSIGAAGEISNRIIAVNQIVQPTALAIDACGGLFIGGTDGGNLRRLAPGGGLTVIARFEGPDVTTMAFGSGKHGWAESSLFALDTWVGTLYEVQIKK